MNNYDEHMHRSASTQTSMPRVNTKDWCLSHRIHVWYITYMYHKNQLNVGKYTSPMDPMGYKNLTTTDLFFCFDWRFACVEAAEGHDRETR